MEPLGSRFEKGAQFPGSIYLLYEKDRTPTPEQFVQALEELETFCKRHLNKSKKKK